MISELFSADTLGKTANNAVIRNIGIKNLLLFIALTVISFHSCKYSGNCEIYISQLPIFNQSNVIVTLYSAIDLNNGFKLSISLTAITLTAYSPAATPSKEPTISAVPP